MSEKKTREMIKEVVEEKPHDKVFKNTFCNKEAILDFLAVNLPPELRSKIYQLFDY